MSEGKKLLPKLRFPEFQLSGDWQLKKIGDYLSESRLPGSKGDVAKKITVKLWGNGVFGKSEAIQGSVNTQYFRRRAGQFIYSKLDFLNQAFGVIPSNLDNYESTVDLPCFDVSRELNSLFLLDYVSRKEFFERVGEAADGSRKAKRIQAETFLASAIATPSSAEQQRIADCLSSLDELIVAQGRKVNALKTHRMGLVQDLFPRAGKVRPALRFPEFLDAGDWAIDTLENLCAAKISYGIVQAGPHTPDGMPYIKSSDLSGELDLGKLSRTSDMIAQKYRRSEVIPGDLVFSLRGNIGECRIVPDGISVANLSRGSARIRPRGTSEFYLHVLQSEAVRDQIATASKGSTFQEVSIAALRKVRVSRPELPEQQRIADCLTSLDTLLATSIQELEALKTHKKGLMQQLFPSPEPLTA